jgi:hypothetical protein
MDNHNESKNLLASGRILNFINNTLQEALLLAGAIILMILFFGCVLSVAVCSISAPNYSI